MEIAEGKALDLATGTMVDIKEMVEIPKTGESAPPKYNKGEEPPIEEKKPEEETEKKTDETPPAEGATPTEEKKPEDEKKPDETPPPAFEAGSYIDQKFGEKYGLKNEADLEEVLNSTASLVDDFKKIKDENAELKKKAENPFRSEQEKKISQFLANFHESKFDEAINTFGVLMGLDPATASSTKVLQESFVLKHPDLNRDEAIDLFKYEHEKKYNLNKDDFDSDEKYNAEKRIRDIQLKNEESAARKELAAKKNDLKVEAKTEEKKTEPDKGPTIPEETVNDYLNQVQKFLNPEKNKVFDRLIYKSDDGKEILFTLPLDKEKQADVKAFMEDYVKNPGFYDKNGKIPNFTPGALAKWALRVNHGDWIESQILLQVKTLAARMKAEQVAGATPEKKSNGTGDMKLSIDDQFTKLAQKTAEDRQKIRR